MHKEPADIRELASYIDHTQLKAFADRTMLETLCKEAVEYGFRSVCVNSVHAALASELLKGTDVTTCVVIGFPLGQTSIAAKVFEAEEAVRNGARELDYVVNVSEVKNGNWEYVKQEMEAIVAAGKAGGARTKVIFENCYLEKEEIRHLASIALEVKPAFIKTSTGFGTGGATIEDVKLMKETVGDAVEIKAAGGIRTYEDVKAYIEAGATRIGASAGVQIIREFEQAEA